MAISLEEILKQQCEKLQDLETTTSVIKSKGRIKEELQNMHAELAQASTGADCLRKYLEQMKEQNDRCKSLLTLIASLDKWIIHMEQNIPPELIHDFEKNANQLSFTNLSETEITKYLGTETGFITEGEDNSIKNCKKTLFQETEVCPSMHLISQDEFSKIPKYIIGRQSLESVNGLITTLNKILTTKYTFLSQGKAHARKHGNMSLYLEYKKQELDMRADNKYVYFFTADDYERETKSKLSKPKLNLLTVLRHCKRLQEHRVKNNVRYILITNNAPY